jgi:hypothetical protein
MSGNKEVAQMHFHCTTNNVRQQASHPNALPLLHIQAGLAGAGGCQPGERPAPAAVVEKWLVRRRLLPGDRRQLQAAELLEKTPKLRYSAAPSGSRKRR